MNIIYLGAKDFTSFTDLDCGIRCPECDGASFEDAKYCQQCGGQFRRKPDEVWRDNADNRGTVTGAELFDVKKGYMQENGTAWVGTINSQEVTIIARGATGLDLYNCLLDDDEVEEVLKPYKYHFKR